MVSVFVLARSLVAARPVNGAALPASVTVDGATPARAPIPAAQTAVTTAAALPTRMNVLSLGMDCLLLPESSCPVVAIPGPGCDIPRAPGHARRGGP